ncbi:MAG: hypothetical protein KDD62_10325 [Bdellovibrionales bacterium]|nr:hypothetical protein [Bdellovibrionales bacterium]
MSNFNVIKNTCMVMALLTFLPTLLLANPNEYSIDAPQTQGDVRPPKPPRKYKCLACCVPTPEAGPRGACIYFEEPIFIDAYKNPEDAQVKCTVQGQEGVYSGCTELEDGRAY